MGLLSNINSGITIGKLGTNVALKYSKSQYQEKIDKLDNCARKLEQHLSNLEGYKEQLKSIWDDEYAAKYQVELEKEIKSVKNAQEQVNNQIQMWQSAIKEMEDTVGGQQEKLQLIKEGLSALDIKD